MDSRVALEKPVTRARPPTPEASQILRDMLQREATRLLRAAKTAYAKTEQIPVALTPELLDYFAGVIGPELNESLQTAGYADLGPIRVRLVHDVDTKVTIYLTGPLFEIVEEPEPDFGEG